MGSEIDARGMRVRNCLSGIEPVMAARLAMPAIGVGPGPDFHAIPALAAIRVRLATVAAMHNWNRVLTRPK